MGVDLVKLKDLTFDAMHEELFREALRKLPVQKNQFVFLDLGCGKGKALLLASKLPFQKAVGVEFSPVLVDICRNNIRLFTESGGNICPIEVVCEDVLTYALPSAPLVVLMYNPFREPLMQAVTNKLKDSLRTNPRPIWISYCNPNHADVIESSGAFEIVDKGKRYRLYRNI
jgi:SAM-dependent methyltransferase